MLTIFQRWYNVCLSLGPVSVCLSVRPSQVGALLKRLNVGSHTKNHTIAPFAITALQNAKSRRKHCVWGGVILAFLLLCQCTKVTTIHSVMYHTGASASSYKKQHIKHRYHRPTINMQQKAQLQLHQRRDFASAIFQSRYCQLLQTKDTLLLVKRFAGHGHRHCQNSIR